MLAEITNIFRPKRKAGTVRPIFVADWRDALFIHYRLNPNQLQPLIPLPLDLWNGQAYLSLVAFTQHRLRPTIGGPAAELLSRPLAHHEFLNLRTYVLQDGKPGIYFVSEWIPNRLAVFLGPRLYGLPYKLGRFAYHTAAGYAMRHVDSNGYFSCVANWNPQNLPAPAAHGSEAEFLLERYTAFTVCGGIVRQFQIAHEPWRTIDAEVTVIGRDLLAEIPAGNPCSAHYSHGLRNVEISWRRPSHPKGPQ